MAVLKDAPEEEFVAGGERTRAHKRNVKPWNDLWFLPCRRELADRADPAWPGFETGPGPGWTVRWCPGLLDYPP